MSAEILSKGEPTANQLRVLDRITRAASRANRLIADLLDFTQARLSTDLALTPKAMNPHAAVRDAIDELAVAFPDRDLRHAKHGEGLRAGGRRQARATRRQSRLQRGDLWGPFRPRHCDVNLARRFVLSRGSQFRSPNSGGN
jgi:signal transduction histidine kinase